MRLRDLVPDTPAIAEPSTGLSMGQSAEKMAKENGISREEQDQIAFLSHKNAAAATDDGRLPAEMCAVFVPPQYATAVTTDNLLRRDTTLPALAALPPVFDRRYGSVTAGNASPLTDGAAAVLLMAEEKARALGYEPLAFIRSWAVAAVDPAGQLLMGPALAIPMALDRAGLKLSDIDLIDMHEAFAAQVASNIQALESEAWAREKLGRASAVGKVDRDRLNVSGGSIAIGHPFGATGARITTTLANELARRHGKFGLLSVCAQGGMGFAMVLGAMSGPRAFTKEVDADGILVLTLDVPGAKVNTLSKAVLEEFQWLMTETEADREVKAVVFRSGKPDNFIAGADIKEFLAIRSALEGETMSRAGHAFLDRLEGAARARGGRDPRHLHGGRDRDGAGLPLPHRLGRPEDGARLARGDARPHAGRGRNQRLPRLIGLAASLDLILTGRTLKATRALKAGLVDEVVPSSVLLAAAKKAALALAAGQAPSAAAGHRTPREAPARP